MILSTLLKKNHLINMNSKNILFNWIKNEAIVSTNKVLFSFNDGPKKYEKRNPQYKHKSNQNNKKPFRKQTSITYNSERRQYKKEHSQVAEYKENRTQNKQIISLFFQKQQETKLSLIQQLKDQQKVRQLSMIAQQMLFQPQSSQTDIIWCALQEAFISSIKPTKDQNQIRSYGKFIYALGKSKKATHNYQTQMALLLPFSSHQSFTQIVTSVSRMGGMSEEFSHIVEKLYWKRKQEFSTLQISLINYVLAKNGKKIDTQLIEYIASFPLKSIAMILKSYDMAGMMSSDILKTCIPMIVARKNETNLLDLREIINIYSKYLCLDDERLMNYIVEHYKILARNVNEQALEQIWEYFPQAVNANKFPIAFVEEVIKSLKILRTRERISERTWKKISITFGKFQNLQIRTKLQKI